MDDKKKILIAGAGNIGSTLTNLLDKQADTEVTLVDKRVSPGSKAIQCDVQNAAALLEIIEEKSINAIVSSLPYYCNVMVAEVAKANHCHYFDFTEDVKTTQDIFILAENAKTAFVPQCGIAPGFINIIAGHFIRQCDSVDQVKLYCGALPQKNNNPLGYALTWSTEGLINEYGNRARVIEDGQLKMVAGLSGKEDLQLGNTLFEAFHTSGGIGTLIDTYQDKVKNMFYKCIRYPGHCEKMQFLMNDLKLNEARDTLKKILEHALPTTKEDVVITYVDVVGTKDKKRQSFTDLRYFYPPLQFTPHQTAIQTVTSLSAAVVIDTILSNPKNYSGPIKQEDFDLDTILNNPIANYLNGSKQ